MTTIQTIKEAEERRKVNFTEAPHDKNSVLQAVAYWELEEDVVQTLIAVFESELDSLPPYNGGQLSDGETYEYRNGRNEALKERRSHLTELINQLKQK